MKADITAISLATLVALYSATSAALPAGVLDSETLHPPHLWPIAAARSALDAAKRAEALAAGGRLEEALAAAQDALALAEAQFGPQSAYVAMVLDILAAIYRQQNQLDDALQASRRAAAIMERTMPGTVEYAVLKSNLAAIYRARGEYRQAEPLFKEAYDTLDARAGAKDPRTATAAGNLGITYLELSRPEEALTYFEKAAAAWRALGQGAGTAYARVMLDSASAQLMLERTEAARASAEAARKIIERSGSEPVMLAEVETTLARVSLHDSDLAGAEGLLHTALNRLDPDHVPSHATAAAVATKTLGSVDFLRGRFVEAEPNYRRALDLFRQRFGPRYPAVADTLHSLALVYQGLGQYDEAEPLFSQALEILENLGPDNPSLAATRVEFAATLAQAGKPERAESEARAALAIYARSKGRWDLRQGYGFAALGAALSKQGRNDEAAAAFEQAVALIKKVRGEYASDLPPGLIELGQIYTAEGRYADADVALERALKIRERDAAVSPWGLAKALSALAQLRMAQGRGEKALEAAERATDIVRKRLDLAERSLSAAAQGEVVNARHIVERRLAIADEMWRSGDAATPEATFDAAQLPHLTSVAAALAETTIKLRPDQRELADLVAERQDALEQWRGLDRSLLDRIAGGALEREDERRLREELERLSARVGAADDAIRNNFPDYADLTNPKPVDTATVAHALWPGEALLLQVTGDEGTFLFLVRADSDGAGNTLSYARTTLTASELEHAVGALRASVTLTPGKASLDDLPPFDVRAAHRLYVGLLAPFELGAVSRLIVVPDGAMQSLPFAILLRNEPEKAPGNRDYAGLRDLEFFGKSVAISTVPSADTFVALRRRAGASRAPRPFLGFGDPLVGSGPPSDLRGAGRGGEEERVIATRAPTPELFWHRGTEFDPQAFQLLDPLPETRAELLALAAAFGAEDPESMVRLGPNATEAMVRSEGDLRDYRVIAFATHGLLAGDFAGLAEPALVLTPPLKPGSTDDDGLLTASEVAGLDLDADWVILSACNTAAGATPGAEGLSGLARAFVHAGSRALLVSHWPAPSAAAAALTVFSAQALAAAPEIGRAEALRLAMLRVMKGEHPDGRPHPWFAHPIFWGPLINVGEGGAGR